MKNVSKATKVKLALTFAAFTAISFLTPFSDANTETGTTQFSITIAEDFDISGASCSVTQGGGGTFTRGQLLGDNALQYSCSIVVDSGYNGTLVGTPNVTNSSAGNTYTPQVDSCDNSGSNNTTNCTWNNPTAQTYTMTVDLTGTPGNSGADTIDVNVVWVSA
jgi:hypothetical protein